MQKFHRCVAERAGWNIYTYLIKKKRGEAKMAGEADLQDRQRCPYDAMGDYSFLFSAQTEKAKHPADELTVITEKTK